MSILSDFREKLFPSKLEKLFSSLKRYCCDEKYRKKFDPEIESWPDKTNIPPFYKLLKEFPDWSTVRLPGVGQSLIMEVMSNCKTPTIGKKLIRFFHAAGVPLAAKNDRGNTALHEVNYFNAEFDPWILEYAQLLLDLGADINITDNTGGTPLHFAASRSILQVKFFIEHGANPFIKDSKGRLPLDNTRYAVYDAAKNRNYLKQAMEINNQLPLNLSFEVKILNEEDYRKISEESYAPVKFDTQFTEEMLDAEYEQLSEALDTELFKQPGNYNIDDDFGGEFLACGQIYSNDAAAPEYISAVMRAISQMPHATNWYYLTVCLLAENETEPVIADNGQFLIHSGVVYAPDDGNDYIRFLSPK